MIRASKKAVDVVTELAGVIFLDLATLHAEVTAGTVELPVKLALLAADDVLAALEQACFECTEVVLLLLRRQDGRVTRLALESRLSTRVGDEYVETIGKRGERLVDQGCLVLVLEILAPCHRRRCHSCRHAGRDVFLAALPLDRCVGFVSTGYGAGWT